MTHWNTHRLLHVCLATLLGMGFAAPFANATALYTYTGVNFTVAEPVFPGPNNFGAGIYSEYISASIAFASPLSDNLVDVDESGSVTSWSISDQDFDFSSSSTLEIGLLHELNITTDSTGSITSAIMGVYGNGPFLYGGISLNESSTTGVCSGLVGTSDCAVYSPSGCMYCAYYAVAPATGVWTQQTTAPEPSTTSLAVLSGLTAIVWFRLRCRHLPPSHVESGELSPKFTLRC